MIATRNDIAHHARLLLRRADVGQRLPTPVDDIVSCAELVVSGHVTLEEEHAGFFTERFDLLRSALKKTLGLVDLIEDTIYLDPNVSPRKQAFLKLHEVTHKMLPWQKHLYLCLDDESTLAPDVKKSCEREANMFAAEVLFQVDRFTRHSRDLPLELGSALDLARSYGASHHATIRRYVEVSHRCCSVMVIDHRRSRPNGDPVFRVVYDLASDGFKRQFGGLRWPPYLNPDSSPMALALLSGRPYVKGEGLVLPDRDGRKIECGFQVYQNSYEAFAFMFPLSEPLRGSRIKRKKRVIKL